MWLEPDRHTEFVHFVVGKPRTKKGYLKVLFKKIRFVGIENSNNSSFANGIFDIFQSAYRPMRNCETALVRIQVDILLSLDKTVILLLLDVSAAFDTVVHHLSLLINQLHIIGVGDNALCWPG